VIDDRPSTDDILMRIAELWAMRSTCGGAQVGAVLARDGRVLSTGYNGAPAGMPHCSCVRYEVDPEQEPCATSVHAEANVIAFAARYGLVTEGTTLYSTLMPCTTCAMLLLNAGVERVVAKRHYHRGHGGYDLLAAAGVLTLVLEESHAG
jgi:dCMP deaminase